MSITTTARQAQGKRAEEVIAKLAEDAYFMRVDNRVTQVPPVRNSQCLMSMTTKARQAQGMRAGEVIAKLAEDAYFTRVDNRVTQVPPPGIASKTMKQ
jgi:hypothetical protein